MFSISRDLPSSQNLLTGVEWGQGVGLQRSHCWNITQRNFFFLLCYEKLSRGNYARKHDKLPTVSGWKRLELLPWVGNTVNSKADRLVQHLCLNIGEPNKHWQGGYRICHPPSINMLGWSVVGGCGWCLRERQRKLCPFVSLCLSNPGHV